MAISCSFPCKCECLTGVVSAFLTIDGYEYKPGSCALSPASDPGTFCCNDAVDVGALRQMNDGCVVSLPAIAGETEPDTGCNCTYQGWFWLYKNGDYTDSSVAFTLTLRFFDSGYVFVEIIGGNRVYTGFAQLNQSCVVVCYDKSYPDPMGPPVYTPKKGVPYFVNPNPPYITVITATAKDDWGLSISISAPESQTACKSICAVSRRMYKNIGGSYPLMRISEGVDGRCPEVYQYTPLNFPDTSSTTPCNGEGKCSGDWKAEGWQCKEFNAQYSDGSYKKDCNGNNKLHLHEHISYKYSGWPVDLEYPCELDCCDLFIRSNYLNPATSECLPEEDRAAWWTPLSESWKKDPKDLCLQATLEAKVVWRFKIGCDWWYNIVPAGVEPWIGDPPQPNPEFPHVIFKYGPPCGVTCKVYDICDGVTIIPPEIPPIMLTAAPGQRLEGSTNDCCLAVVSDRWRQKIENENPMCELESYEQACAINISPFAPEVLYEVYNCPDCVECYEDDETTPRQGFVPTRYYSEYVYGPTAQDAADNALARAAAINATVGDVVPYAHLNVPSGGEAAGGWVGNPDSLPGGILGNAATAGCCAGNWDGPTFINSLGYGSHGRSKWADLDHVDPCGWNVKYNSVVPNPDPNPPPEKAYRAELMLCCRCLLPDNLCNSGDQKNYNSMRNVDFEFTDFWNPPKVPSIPDADGNYCRDFATGAALAQAYRAFADAQYGTECWGWFNYSTATPWNYITDVWRYGVPDFYAYDVTGYDCRHVVTKHTPHNRTSRYDTSVSLPTSGYMLACKQSSNDGNWYWLGVYRECRWCYEPCSEESGCSENPCQTLASFSDYAYTATAEMCWSCTTSHAAEAKAAMGRGNIYSWPRIYVPKCDGSLYPNTANTDGSFAACAVFICFDVCKAIPLGFDYFHNYNDITFNANCSGYVHDDYPPTVTVEYLLSVYSQMKADCISNGLSVNGGYRACLSVEECCNREDYDTNPAHYYVYTSPESCWYYEEYNYWYGEYSMQVNKVDPWPSCYQKPVPCYIWKTVYTGGPTGCTNIAYYESWAECSYGSYACSWRLDWIPDKIC